MNERQRICINDTELFIRTSGTAKKAILMIHGAGMSSAYWLPQLQNERLMEHYRLLAVDLPGHGASPWLSGNPAAYQPGQLALLIEPLLKALDMSSYVLAGLSFGTNVIGEIRQPLPGCKGIILASPCIVNDQNPPPTVITATHNAHVVIAPHPTEEELLGYVYHYEKNKAIADQYIRDYKNTDPQFRTQLGQMMMTAGWSDELGNISNWKVPVAVVFGAADAMLNQHYLDHYPPLWKGRTLSIDGAGHMIPVDRPEQFNDVLLDFSNEVLK